jgi:TonB-linked SusC/RagA family outer membrane protein
MLMKKISLFIVFLCSFVFVVAQNKVITGKVTDANANPLASVSVVVKGTNIGTFTKPDGTFSINVPSNRRVLIFSYTDLSTEEVNIGNQNSLTVSLKSVEKTLQEVVVTGYGVPQRRKNTTAAISTVSGKELENKPYPSVDKMLQGKVPGLVAPQQSGQPGGDQQIRIRGIGSISAGANPLFVIDGVILNTGDLSRLTTTANTLAGINANDIEDVTILKDAQATALYGSRGANGVILITTKTGKVGKTKFRADAEIGFTRYADVPPAGRGLNADEWLMLYEEGLRNAGFTQANIDAQLISFGKGTGIDTDWFDLVTRQGQQQQYNLSASGGEGKTTFYISGGYFKQEASVKGSDFKRYSAAANFKHTASNKLTIGLNLNGNSSIEHAPFNGGAFANPTGAIAFLRPTMKPYNDDGTINITRTGNINFNSGVYNPLYGIENDQKNLNTVQFRGNVNAEYAILQNLKLTTRYGVDYNTLNEFRFDNPFHGDARTLGGRGLASDTRVFNWTSTTQLLYNLYPDRKKDFKIDASIGYEAQKSKTEALDASANSYPPTSQLPLSVNAATVTNGKLTASDYDFTSIISTAAINYKGRYIVSGSFRRDGSSRFSENNRFGNFWSVGGAWNIDREDFFPETNIVNNLKLRASYGITGNANITNYGWRQTFGYGANYNGLPGGTFNSVGNSELTWEGNKQFDIGIDGSFLKNRITVVADYYRRVSSDLLFADPLSLVTGFTSITRNIGEVENKGFEISISATPVSTKDFHWDISFNISHNKNKVTKLPGGKDIIDQTNPFILRVGEPFQNYYGRVYVGVDPANGDPLWYKDSTHTIIVNNRSLATREVLKGKTAAPKYYGGFSNTLTYKGFSVTADLFYNYGNYVSDGWVFYLIDGVDPLQEKYAINLQRWQKPGDITTVPKYVYGATNNSSSFSTRFLQKGDFMRLRNITIGYSLNSNILSKLHLSSLNFYIRGTNLWTKTYDKNLTIDPEQGVNAQSNLDIYYTKSITAGLNMGF